MHSIIRQGQFHGQLPGQFTGQRKANRAKTLTHAAHLHELAHATPGFGRAEWRQRSLIRGGPDSGRIDVCRLIVATLGLALYLAIPFAAVGFALNILFG